MNILVSACLFGMNCKYDGGNNLSEKVRQLKDDHTLILVCPEQLGGLDTPRLPSEIQMESDQKKPRVISSDGEDVTEAFVRGAEITLNIAKVHECKLAIMKEHSPSCGVKQVYDGSFSGKLVDGAGITSQMLMEHGITVISEEDDFSIIEKLMVD